MAAIALVTASGAAAQQIPTSTVGFYGTPGLIDMPTAGALPDGQLSVTVAHIPSITRNTVSFQITPRLTGSFRYSAHGNPIINYDRSFDVHYILRPEDGYMPSLAIGLRDAVGTGWYSSEYLVATRTVSPRLKVTGGIGWGRLGSYNSIRNPLSSVFGSGFDTRPGGTLGLGGVPSYNRWFRGPAAMFGGIEWQTPIRNLTFKAEYSSDAYTIETVTNNFFTRRTPFNFALSYRLRNGATLTGYYLYGDQIGISGSFSLNPRLPANASSLGPAPTPVLARGRGPYDTSWTSQKDGADILRQNVNTLLQQDGMELEAMRITATSAEVWFQNKRFEATPQAIGRVARVLTQVLPASVETFRIVPVKNGIGTVAVTVRRRDVEELEHDPQAAEKIYGRAQITDAGKHPPARAYLPGTYPERSWSLGPYAMVSLFDPDKPVRMDLGLRLQGEYEVRPGLILSGSIRKKVVGNLNSVTRVSNSVMRHVRSDYGLYDKQGDPALEYLEAEYFYRPGKNLYGRVSVGYFEKMYGGLSTEILWKPVNSKLAFGVEINAVKQRAFNQLLGFQPYGVVTGHASAYWDIGNGFYGQLDVGRYLAGDYGATVTIDRVFDNGWKIGAFFTLTNVPFSTFGEGSFDKGLRFSVPLSWLTGQPTPKVFTSVMRPITRDGGARLEVRNRLYGLLENDQGGPLQRRWGRFWR